MQAFSLLKGERSKQLARIASFLAGLSTEKVWLVEVKQVQRKRSDAQNRYLWGVCYPTIMRHLEGWEANDVHEYCLGEFSGWEVIEGLGRKRMKPIHRSSKMSVTQFMDYVAWIQQRMAEEGIYIPDPGEMQ